MSPTPSQNTTRPRGEPLVAVLLTLFIPGAGHLYMGRIATALIAFVVVEGLYALGFFLSEGQVFAFLDPELRGPFAVILSPEAANLGALLWHQREAGFGPPQPMPWPEWIMTGSALTALSGIANIWVMVQAHLDARLGSLEKSRGPSPTVQVAAAWAVPGLGHLLQGRVLRALIVFALLVGLFAAGTLMADFSNLSRERHFYDWSGQFLLGLPAMAVEFLSGRPRVTGPIAHADVGLLFACLAGLLNVLAMLDVYRHAEGRLLAEPEGSDGARGAQEVAG